MAIAETRAVRKVTMLIPCEFWAVPMPLPAAADEVAAADVVVEDMANCGLLGLGDGVYGETIQGGYRDMKCSLRKLTAILRGAIRRALEGMTMQQNNFVSLKNVWVEVEV
jgi:predicted amino acid dehydrogenase